MQLNYKIFSAAIYLLAALLSTTSIYAQAAQEWDVYFGSSVVPKAMAVDAGGNAYVAGFGFTSGQGYNFIIVKFNSAGIKEWDNKFNGPSNTDDNAYFLTIDDNGNIYVTGVVKSGSSNSTSDIATVKYNNAGEEQWSVIFNGEANDFDSPNAVTTDNEGNVYVTGISTHTNGNSDYITIKYDPSGEEQWKAFYNGPGNSTDEANAIALDSQNNIYITGRSRSGSFSSTYDFATIKYSSAGAEQWVERYNGPAGDYDEGVSIAVDELNNVYVTGSSTGNETLYDYATIKYNSSGEEQWVRRYNGEADREDIPVKLMLDLSGNIYVTGNSRKTSSLGSEDYATLKYNSSGDELWIKRFDGDASEKDFAVDMVLDGGNSVYVTGYSYTGSAATSKDICTIKYTSDGSEDWISFYNNSDNTGDEPVGLGSDNSGNIYVAGVSKQAYLAVKYSQPTGVGQISHNVPDGYVLSQNYPNPFNPTTNFEFKIADRGFVSLKVYNVLGNEIATLINEEKTAGVYKVSFDGSNLSSGVYFYKFETSNFTETKKMILTK